VGLGRNPEAVSRLSLSTQVTVVATTGRHRDAHYSDQAWAQSGNEALWEKILVHELTCGMAQEDEGYAISDPDRLGWLGNGPHVALGPQSRPARKGGHHGSSASQPRPHQGDSRTERIEH